MVGQTYSGPAITFSTQPTIETVPGSEVSYIKDTDYDMYRVGSDWYMNYNGNWYRASNYTGPYVVVETTTVPTAVISVPVNYRKHWSH